VNGPYGTVFYAQTDFLIIGSGIAGLTFAVKTAKTLSG